MGSRLRGWVESGDLAQQVQYEALRTYERKTFPNLRAFRGWLLRILSNLAASESRRLGIEQEVGGAPDAPHNGRSPSRIVAARDSENWMRDRLGVLAERERLIVLSRVVDGQAFSVIGEQLDVSEGHARVIFHRSLEKLRGNSEGDSLA